MIALESPRGVQVMNFPISIKRFGLFDGVSTVDEFALNQKFCNGLRIKVQFYVFASNSYNTLGFEKMVDLTYILQYLSAKHAIYECCTCISILHFTIPSVNTQHYLWSLKWFSNCYPKISQIKSKTASIMKKWCRFN